MVTTSWAGGTRLLWDGLGSTQSAIAKARMAPTAWRFMAFPANCRVELSERPHGKSRSQGKLAACPKLHGSAALFIGLLGRSEGPHKRSGKPSTLKCSMGRTSRARSGGKHMTRRGGWRCSVEDATVRAHEDAVVPPSAAAKGYLQERLSCKKKTSPLKAAVPLRTHDSLHLRPEIWETILPTSS